MVDSEYHRRWRLANLEKCKTNSRKNYQKHGARYREAARIKRREERKRVLDFYGSWCHCPGGCSETYEEFLTVEHINGSGRLHRKVEKIKNICTWLCRKYPDGNFPDWLTVFCWNCNCSRGHYGHCPHEKEHSEQS